MTTNVQPQEKLPKTLRAAQWSHYVAVGVIIFCSGAMIFQTFRVSAVVGRMDNGSLILAILSFVASVGLFTVTIFRNAAGQTNTERYKFLRTVAFVPIVIAFAWLLEVREEFFNRLVMPWFAGAVVSIVTLILLLCFVPSVHASAKATEQR